MSRTHTAYHSRKSMNSDLFSENIGGLLRRSRQKPFAVPVFIEEVFLRAVSNPSYFMRRCIYQGLV